MYIFLFLIIFIGTTSGEPNKNNNKRNEILSDNVLSSFTFFDDQLCLANFDVSEGSIIRTKDSLALGGRYINVSELGDGKAKDDCLRLCCKTPHCNVITFEEKRSGSCYMFDCGSVENFLCKFTDQSEFMSAILRKRVEPLLNLPQVQQSPNRHEVELSQLRKTGIESKGSQSRSVTMAETDEPVAKEKHFNSTSTLDKNDNFNGGGSHRCSRYQFECKSSNECIGIYNACDGISQCPDGSDEAAELNCPNSNGRPGIIKGTEPKQSVGSGTAFHTPGGSGSGDMGSSSITVKSPQQHQSQDFNPNHHKIQEFPSPSRGSGSNYEEHAEKNGNMELPSQPNNIFNHKDGGLMEDSYGNQLQQQRQNNPYNYWKSYDYGLGESPGGFYGQGQPIPQPGRNLPFYNNPVGSPNLNGNYGNGQFKFPAYGDMPPFNNAPNPDPMQMIPPLFPVQGQQQQYNPNGIPDIKTSPYVPVVVQTHNGNPHVAKVEVTTIKTLPETPTPGPNTLKPLPTQQPSSIHGDLKKPDSKQLDDQILESLLNKASLPVPQVDTINYGGSESESPSPGAGAVLAFVVGLGMSAAMVVIATCRLRRIRMSSRRRGKNRLDPDYLTDGMYL